jgi:hypothetical protein
MSHLNGVNRRKVAIATPLAGPKERQIPKGKRKKLHWAQQHLPRHEKHSPLCVFPFA